MLKGLDRILFLVPTQPLSNFLDNLQKVKFSLLAEFLVDQLHHFHHHHKKARFMTFFLSSSE